MTSLAPPQGFRRFQVTAVTRESASIRSFVLEPVDRLPLPAFVPGQFVVVRVEAVSGETWLRNYSLSGDPHDAKRWRISVKREPAPPGRDDLPVGRVSNHLHAQIDVGAQLDLKGPSGAFMLDETGQRPVVLLSGGVGITPMISMLHRLATRTTRTTHFIHACENGDVHAFRDEAARLAAIREKNAVHICYRTPSADDVAQQRFHSAGLIARETIQRLLPLDDYEVYLCGPPAFMQANWRLLRSLGVDRARIHFEFFGPATVLDTEQDENEAPQQQRASSTAPSHNEARTPSVTFAPSTERFTWDASSHSLLDFCEASGFSPEFSCRAGVCGTCSTRLISGNVTYFEEPLDPPPDGEVLLCCSRPLDAVTLQLTQTGQGSR
jgi:uncharacterized protein